MPKKKTKLEVEVFVTSNSEILYKENEEMRIKDFLDEWVEEQIIITYQAIATRSLAQNSFFHGNIVPAVQRCMQMLGLEKAWSREYIKEVILKKPLLTVNHGTDDEYIRPTSSLTVEEFWEFCRRCLGILLHFGGSLNEREQAEYDKIIERYHLEEAIQEVLTYDK